MKSLRGRLIALLLVGIVVAAATTSYLVYLQANDEVSELYDAHLRQIATLLSRQANLNNWQDIASAELAGVDKLRHWEEEEFLIQVWSKDGVLVDSLPNLEAGFQVPLQAEDGLQSRTHASFDWRIYRADGPNYIVQVGQLDRPRARTIEQTSIYLLFPLLLQIPLFLVVAWLAVRLGLLPLDSLSRELGQRRPELLQPLSDAGLPGELQPLVRSLNTLLQRLDTALQHQRNFVGDAAHELRTPITALRLQLDALRRADTAPERAEVMDALDAGIARASTLVHQLLLIARAENASIQPATDALSLERIGAEALERHLPAARAGVIDLGMKKLEDGSLRAAPGDIETVLDNLLSNAIRYSPAGSRVDLSLYAPKDADKDDSRGDTIVIEVTDNGPGIPVAERERVFDRFYRLPDTVAAGTGLGLAIAKTICERNGARISIESGADQRGTRVRVEWPG
jgi:two-component system OmpR family sensor kinase